MTWPANPTCPPSDKEMNTVKPMIRNAATLILVARNRHLKSYIDYRILLLERGAKSKFMVCTKKREADTTIAGVDGPVRLVRSDCRLQSKDVFSVHSGQ